MPSNDQWEGNWIWSPKNAPIQMSLHQEIKAPEKTAAVADDKAGYRQGYGHVCAFDVTAHGGYMAAVFEDSGVATRLVIWDLKPERLVCTTILAQQPRLGITTIRFSPNGRLLAIPRTKERTVELWDTKTGKCQASGQTDGEPADVSWHPDGSRLAIAAGDCVEIWTVDPFQSATMVRAHRSEYERALCARWSPDGEYMAIGTSHPAVYIQKGGAQSPSLGDATAGAVYGMEWSSDGRYLAASGFGNGSNLAIWEYPTSSLNPGAKFKCQLADTLLAPAADSYYRPPVWDPTGRVLGVVRHNGFVTFVRLPGGGQLDCSLNRSEQLRIPSPGAKPRWNVREAHWGLDYLATLELLADQELPYRTFRLWKVLIRSVD